MELVPHRRHRGELGLLNPQNLARIARIGGHAGREIRNAWDRYREQQVPDTTEPIEDDNPDDNADNPPINTDRSGGGSGAGIGFRGAMVGNTTLHKGYGMHYHELEELHSKKLKQFQYTWGFKGKSNAVGDNTSPFERTNSLTGTANNVGIVMINVNQIGESPYNNINNQANVSMADYIYSHAMNWTVDDLIDNKLLNSTGTRGLMTQWQKFRLKSFTIHIRPTSTIGSTFNKSEPYATTPLWPAANIPAITMWQSPFMGTNNHIKQDYWVYRDVYNDYTTATSVTNIPAIPPEALTTNTLDTYSRGMRTIRNFDTYSDILHDGEEFCFTREINSKASYYLTQAQLQALRTQNIQVLVAALEGLDGVGTTVTPFVESFNLLIAPTNPPCVISGLSANSSITTTQGPVPICLLFTTLDVKITAKWDAFDYNYAVDQGPQPKGIDEATMTLISNVEQRIINNRRPGVE